MASDLRRRYGARWRLKKRRDFLRVQRRGAKTHVRFFMVFTSGRPRVQEDEVSQRLGITVTKKVGNAVRRNAVKRRVREVFRHRRGELPIGMDFVFVAKRNAARVSYAEVLADFDALAGQLAPRGRP